ncbi:Ig-like domain-containing protein, partial [Levilactobacillus spicheri]
MRKFWQMIVITIVGLFAIVFSPPVVSHAATMVTASGVTANDAVIKNKAGKVMSHSAILPRTQYFKVTWDWRLPSFTTINKGDYFIVGIPDNVYVPQDESGSVTNMLGSAPIGTFTIAKGAHTGTVTLNKISTSTFNRHGYLFLDVVGAGATDGAGGGVDENGGDGEEGGDGGLGVNPVDPTDPSYPTDPGFGGGPGEPGTTEPGTTEPGTSEPGTTEPGTTEPGTSEPGTTEPGTTEPG